MTIRPFSTCWLPARVTFRAGRTFEADGILLRHKYIYKQKITEGRQDVLRIEGTTLSSMAGRISFMVLETKLHNKHPRVYSGLEAEGSTNPPGVKEVGGWAVEPPSLIQTKRMFVYSYAAQRQGPRATCIIHPPLLFFSVRFRREFFRKNRLFPTTKVNLYGSSVTWSFKEMEALKILFSPLFFELLSFYDLLNQLI